MFRTVEGINVEIVNVSCLSDLRPEMHSGAYAETGSTSDQWLEILTDDFGTTTTLAWSKVPTVGAR